MDGAWNSIAFIPLLSYRVNPYNFQLLGVTTNRHSFFGRFCRSSIPSLAAITLLVLAWGSVAFCQEIHDATRNDDLAKMQALLKGNPDMVFSKHNDGNTPLHWAAAGGPTGAWRNCYASTAGTSSAQVTTA